MCLDFVHHIKTQDLLNRKAVLNYVPMWFRFCSPHSNIGFIKEERLFKAIHRILIKKGHQCMTASTFYSRKYTLS